MFSLSLQENPSGGGSTKTEVTKHEKLFCDYKYKEVSVLHPNMNTKGTVNNVTLCRKYVLLEYSQQKPDPPIERGGQNGRDRPASA